MRRDPAGTPTTWSRPSPPAMGIALMSAAMLTIPVVDGLAKHLSAAHSPLMIGWARYAVACAITLPIAAALHGPRLLRMERPVSHLLRTLCLVAAMTLYFLAIARAPLATAAGAYFIGPVVAAGLSVFLLGERMTRRKSLSLALGLLGAIVILRPGTSTEPGVLLALGAGVFFAFYLIATRRAAQADDPVKTLTFQCTVGAVLLTPQAVLYWSAPAWSELVLFAGLGLFSILSHFLSIVAFRFADASTLAPLVYVELIGVALVGYLAFGEVPGIPILVGAGFIAAAGLVSLAWRDRRSPGA
ncbi:DMT family transporter [Arenibaculum sp.]|jgi:drug/metabolite transporter (DMT)-like permease|uniref:DMT family transporter n=1 Tax=Arenibaculum sp. TaxID=2865862 RepID=UPI002E130593|nr:EamA family transporter [Arenibaculum sp.]